MLGNGNKTICAYNRKYKFNHKQTKSKTFGKPWRSCKIFCTIEPISTICYNFCNCQNKINSSANIIKGYRQHSYFRANNKLIYNAYVISFRSRLLMIKLLSIIINGFAVVHLIFILNINLSLPSRLLCITIRELLWLMSYSTDTHEELSWKKAIFGTKLLSCLPPTCI